MKQLKYLAFVAIMVCFGCSSSDDGDSPENGDGGEPIQATYRVIFEPNFTTQFHPNDYPDDAAFIKPIIVAHSASTSIYSVGSSASPGLKLYAEDGDSSTLFTEHTGGEDNVNPIVLLQGTDNVGPTESKTYTITITPSTTLISFVTKISPSPDWFLGVNSVNLVTSDNTLLESTSFELYAIDAGTDAGATYESANDPVTESIKVRTGQPLSDNDDETGKNLGTLTIERVINN